MQCGKRTVVGVAAVVGLGFVAALVLWLGTGGRAPRQSDQQAVIQQPVPVESMPSQVRENPRSAPPDQAGADGISPAAEEMPEEEERSQPLGLDIPRGRMQELLALHREAVRREPTGTPVADTTVTHPDAEALAEADRRYVIKLKSRSLLPGRGKDVIFDGDTRTVLLQFWHSPNMFQEQRLTSLGVELLQASPGNAYHAHVRRDTFDRLMAAPFVRGAAPLEVEDRLARSVVENDIGDYAMTKDGRMLLVWRGYRGTSQAELTAAAVGIDGVVLSARAGRNHAIFIEATQQGARALAGLDITHWIEPVAPPPAPSNVQAAQASGVEVLYGAPSNLTGAGVKIMLLDGGAARETHVDLVGRVTVLESGQPSGEPFGDHATHVAGTIAGNGTSDTDARGMATGAQLYSYSFYEGTTEEQLDKIESAFETYGCRLSNHSWGSGIGYRWNGSEWVMGFPESMFGEYTGVSADWDEAIYGNELVIVKAAGNDRIDGPGGTDQDGTLAGDGEFYDLIGPLAGVKNAITVGAASDAASYLGTDGMTAFSCFGPTDDGRLKPDIVFNGDKVWSCGAASDTAGPRA